MTNAIATLLFTQSYLPGVLVLAKTLRQQGVPQDTKLVVLLATQLTQFQKEQLEQVYDELVETSLIHAPHSHQLTLLNRPELSPTYSKINLFKLTQFNTVLYLDADTLPLTSFSSELFHKYDNITEDQIVASPDSGWPDIFNSGLFLFKPSIQTYGRLLDKIQYTDSPSFDGADQGLLNQYFHLDKDNDQPPREWIKLPFLYNVTPTGQYEYEPAYNYFGNQINLVHYIGNTKPWENPQDYSGLKDRWWNKFHEFYGQDGNISEHVHGIVPVYYTPVEEQFESIKEEEEVQPPQEDHQEEHNQNYEEANQVLLNPKSFEHFETVEPNPDQWNPAVEVPPKDGKPEAPDFPSDIHGYSDWNYHDQNNNDNDIAEQYIAEELEVEWKPPPIFPWEFEANNPKPERVFDNSTEEFDSWDSLPLIKKIKETQKKDQIEEVKERRTSITEDLIEAKYLEEQKERLQEIEKRYTGSIDLKELEQDLDVVLEQVEDDLSEERDLPQDINVYHLTTETHHVDDPEIDPLEE